jgi:V/A-type H+-transporting ATPase subunit A
MKTQNVGRIVKVSGPLIEVENMGDCKMFDVVKIGAKHLIGEIIEMRGDRASVQVYEETSGIGPGEEVISTGSPLSVELAPGLIGGIFDGIARPLDKIAQKYGDYIPRGVEEESVSRTTLWHFYPTAQVGDSVVAGDELGYVDETIAVKHKILVPIGLSGTIEKITEGDFNITQTVAVIKSGSQKTDVCMLQKWPVRIPRPFKKKMSPSKPMLTGQRVIDTLFPIALGGVGAVPGPFGSGKTVVQHQLAKWSDVDIIVYVGCGERGNEMTDVLNEFPTLIDPKTGKPLMKRTVLIANTSDMPVTAREASIYTGITIAEYFRDMGYNVAIMADSTSRWAEALREMSARLEEMPGEEGYPAYLSSRLAEFYERAGLVQVECSGERVGSITAIGAVSPPGGDLSEPVSQATLRIVKVFLGLSASLAYKRHFPAIDWLQSYSLYSEKLRPWFEENVSYEFTNEKRFATKILQEESSLNEIVRLVGADSLSYRDRIVMETAKMIREDFLLQNAYDKIDTCTSITKQEKMLGLIKAYFDLASTALDDGVNIADILGVKVKEQIARAKYILEDNLAEFGNILVELKNEFKSLEQKGDESVERI